VIITTPSQGLLALPLYDDCYAKEDRAVGWKLPRTVRCRATSRTSKIEGNDLRMDDCERSHMIAIREQDGVRAAAQVYFQGLGTV